MPETDAYSLQYDEQGRPFYQFPGQPRNYVSPAAFGKPIGGNPESAWHSAPQWNQHTGEAENPFKWGKALNYGVGGALGLGVADAAMPGGLFGAGGGGAASSFNPVVGGAYIPGAEAAMPASLAAENAAFAAGAFNPFVGGNYIPGGEATMPGALAAENATGITPPGVRPPNTPPPTKNIGQDLLDQLKSGKGIMSLASLIPMLMAAHGGGNSNGGGDPLSQNPQLNSLLDMSVNRAQRTDPLHQAVTQLAMSRLPTNVQR